MGSRLGFTGDWLTTVAGVTSVPCYTGTFVEIFETDEFVLELVTPTDYRVHRKGSDAYAAWKTDGSTGGLAGEWHYLDDDTIHAVFVFTGDGVAVIGTHPHDDAFVEMPGAMDQDLDDLAAWVSQYCDTHETLTGDGEAHLPGIPT